MMSGEPKASAIRIAPVILAGGAGAIVWALLQFWGANPEYLDRFLILAASGWIAWSARAQLLALPHAPCGSAMCRSSLAQRGSRSAGFSSRRSVRNRLSCGGSPHPGCWRPWGTSSSPGAGRT